MVDNHSSWAGRLAAAVARYRVPAVDQRRWGVLAGMQHPFEVFLLLVSSLAGTAFLLGARPPTSLEKILPPALVYTWFTMLLVSGIVGLIGCFWLGSNVATGLLLERAAMWFSAAAGIVYTVGLFTNVGWGATGAAMYVTAYTAACLVRAGGITSTLSRLHRPER